MYKYIKQTVTYCDYKTKSNLDYLCVLSPPLTPDNHNSNVLLYTLTPRIQLVARGAHTLSVIKTGQLILYREIIGVCSEIHT